MRPAIGFVCLALLCSLDPSGPLWVYAVSGALLVGGMLWGLSGGAKRRESRSSR